MGGGILRLLPSAQGTIHKSALQRTVRRSRPALWVLLDRTGLSGRNAAAFSDECGRIFIYYTLNEVCTIFGCGHDKATRLFVELEKHGLLIRKRQGKGKPNRLYVQKFRTDG